MRIPLSDRLQACCSFVHPGDRVADIGCDHGYLGIYLLKNGIAQSVIAADIREGPLQSAVKNSEKFGVRGKMTFYLSDGVQNIPREFDTLVCAGMGGDTMVSRNAHASSKRSRYFSFVIFPRHGALQVRITSARQCRWQSSSGTIASHSRMP